MSQENNFININHHIINLRHLKFVKYWQKREMLEIAIVGDRRFYFYIPKSQSNFIIHRLQQAIYKKKEVFHFHFNRQEENVVSKRKCFFPFSKKKRKEDHRRVVVNEETTLIFPDPINQVSV